MRCRIAIGIPTIGRAPILRETLRELALQRRPADSVIVCGTKPADVEGAEEASPGVRVLMAEPGLPRQRNAVIAAADADVLVPSTTAFNTIRLSRGYRQTMVQPRYRRRDRTSGWPTASVARAYAERPCDDGSRRTRRRQPVCRYGCNMAPGWHRCAGSVRFDERLRSTAGRRTSISRRLAGFGTIVLVEAARGVHLGVKIGRGSGCARLVADRQSALSLARSEPLSVAASWPTSGGIWR
jgi:hypothetical protein